MSHSTDRRIDILFMFISAAIFAYFGFATSWSHQYTTTTPPKWLPMVAVLMWTLRAGAVAFVLTAVLTMLKLGIGELLYAVAGVVTAALFVVVAIWEWTNPHGYYSGVPAFVLIIFAIWNGYASITTLRNWQRAREQGAHGTATGEQS